MLSVPNFTLYLTKESKACKIHCFFLKKLGPTFHLCSIFFSLNNAKKKLNDNVPKMFNFNLKMSSRKYPIFCSCYYFLNVNVSDFCRYFTGKVKIFEP